MGVSWAQLESFDLVAGGAPVVRPLKASGTSFPYLQGFAGGCPLFANYPRGYWRSCDSCDGPSFAAGAGGAVSSVDGRYLATLDSFDARSTTLWRVLPEPEAVAVFPLRPEAQPWDMFETPLAVSRNGRRLITGTTPTYPCYAGPSFEAQVHDVESGQLIDALPPGLTSADAALRVLAYGPQIWCAVDR
jgi:hypothetical protein